MPILFMLFPDIHFPARLDCLDDSSRELLTWFGVEETLVSGLNVAFLNFH